MFREIFGAIGSLILVVLLGLAGFIASIAIIIYALILPVDAPRHHSSDAAGAHSAHVEHHR